MKNIYFLLFMMPLFALAEDCNEKENDGIQIKIKACRSLSSEAFRLLDVSENEFLLITKNQVDDKNQSKIHEMIFRLEDFRSINGDEFSSCGSLLASRSEIQSGSIEHKYYVYAGSLYQAIGFVAEGMRESGFNQMLHGPIIIFRAKDYFKTRNKIYHDVRSQEG